MNHLYARSVFFVRDAERSLRFYTEQLGFASDWSYKEGDRVFVCQVSLLGFEVILNEVGEETRSRTGQGRIFIGLEEDQVVPLRAHIAARHIATERRQWGQSTLVIRDLDGNEIFFWLPHRGDWTD